MNVHRRFQDIHIAPAIILLASAHHGIHLYLDPGAGSIVLQAVLGALVAALVAARLFWARIKALFSKLFSRSRSCEQHEDEKH